MSHSSPSASDRPAVLVIAATDSSGGAGLTRDVRVLAELATDALCATTAVTAQSDARVSAVHLIPPAIVRAQIAAAFATRPLGAIKIGMLGSAAIVAAVAAELGARERLPPLVLDPVLVSTSGAVLLDAEGRQALLELLLPRTTVITPNVPELAALQGECLAQAEGGLVAQGRALLQRGCAAVLVKGGHRAGPEAVDLLIQGGQGEIEKIMSKRLPGSSRGTGCALSSAIASGLAHGRPLAMACRDAKTYVLGMLS